MMAMGCVPGVFPKGQPHASAVFRAFHVVGSFGLTFRLTVYEQR